MGKGSQRRPSFIGREEYDLRHDLAFGYITREEFDRKYESLRREGKVTRDGKVVR